MSIPAGAVVCGDSTFLVSHIRAWKYEGSSLDFSHGNTSGAPVTGRDPRTLVWICDCQYPFAIAGDHRETLRVAVEELFAHLVAPRLEMMS